MPKNRGLGRGLGSLIQDAEPREARRGAAKAGSDAAAATKTETEKHSSDKMDAVREAAPLKEGQELVDTIRISLIEPDPAQARRIFDEEALQQLADSIAEHGVLTPILVLKKGRHYELIAGERRWRAAKLAGLKEIPAIVRDYDSQKRAEIALIDNLQRENLNAVEEAMAYERLMEEFHLTQEEIAGRVQKSRPAVANALRLLKLPEAVRQMVMEGVLSGGHARTLLALPEDVQESTARQVVAEELSVRETERLVKKMLEPPKPVKVRPFQDTQTQAAYEKAERALENRLNTRVRIAYKPNGAGRIEVSYASLEELERLMDLMGGAL